MDSKPESHFHEHRDKEYVTQYFPEIFGTIKQGPSTNVVISLVKFRKSDATLGYYIDLRCNSYSVTKNKYYNSKKGITIPVRHLGEVIRALASLPEKPPADIPETGNKKIVSLQKYPNIDLCVSLTNADGTPKVDIREWVRDAMHSYEGFTYKGVRFDYDLTVQVSNVLMNIYNKLEENKH